jgi:hypothetical protein
MQLSRIRSSTIFNLNSTIFNLNNNNNRTGRFICQINGRHRIKIYPNNKSYPNLYNNSTINL